MVYLWFRTNHEKVVLMIELKYVDGDGDEVVISVPSHNVVCDECDGEGFVLAPGMREHAYSQEEFNESFSDDEDRAAYFQRGGKYDVTCPCCKGKNVVKVPDVDKMSGDVKAQYIAYCEYREEKARFDSMWNAERNMERMMGC
jgi:RecJ-like exonuclease